MKTSRRRYKTSYIELILSQSGNETENETERKTEDDHEIENDEIENENKQQCRKKLSKYTKTDDAKKQKCSQSSSFHQAEKLKKKLFFREEKFFSKCELCLHLLLVSIKTSNDANKNVLFDLIKKCQINQKNVNVSR